MLTFHPRPSTGDGATPHPDAVWIDLFDAAEAEARMVEDHTGLRLPSLEQLSEIEQSSRQSFDGGVLRLSTPVMAMSDTDHPKLSYIGLILTPKVLITVRYEALKIFAATAEATCGEGKTPSSALVFTALIESFVGRQADLLEVARAELDEISHGVFRTQPTSPRRVKRSNAAMRQKLQRIGRIGERISMIREALLAIDRNIPFALDEAAAWFAPDLTARLAGVRRDIDSLNQFEEHLLGKVQFLLDAVMGFIGIEQNDIFKVLTIASVVGIFPTLVAGVYGMNFHNMPEYAWTYGYQWGLGLIVATTILPLVWFKWRGWM